jgi:hypothetical protein
LPVYVAVKVNAGLLLKVSNVVPDTALLWVFTTLDIKKSNPVPLPPDGGALTQVPALEVRTFPVVPGATKVGEEVPAPTRTLPAVRVARPVPPPATEFIPTVAVTPECDPVKLGKFQKNVVTGFVSVENLLFPGGKPIYLDLIMMIIPIECPQLEQIQIQQLQLLYL